MQTRKRGAPGANPPAQQPQQGFGGLPYQQGGDISNQFGDQFLDWNQGDGSINNLGAQYTDQSVYDNNIYNTGLNGNMGMDSAQGLGPALPPNSTELVRRNPNQQLATRNRTSWPDSGDGLQQPPSSWDQLDDEDERDLEQRALVAKREAQAKRKQIPPFVQKLSSFLDESKNTERIRWSDDGRSFIVVDEDEFAKTLIPELFKHNNYASFVRQLNMYGFHKRVGLSDNSMKASENKRKTPSEYWNQYFRRGRPELLWLIQKPKNPPSAKRKREDGKGGVQPDSDDEGKKYVPNADVQDQTGAEVARAGNQDLTTIPNSELANLRQELVTLQRQQKLISTVIGQIKRQNDQLYQQATAFQAMHDRHESSINAILTFLATFYNRSLEGHGNANLADMFKHSMPQTNTQQGNVMEMPDVPLDMSIGNQTQGRSRRPLALLPAPDSKPQPDSPITVASSTRQTVSPKPRNQPPPVFRSQNGSARSNANHNSTLPSAAPTSPMIKTDAETPNLLGNTDDVMSLINAANATSPASTIDFSSALEQYQTANGKTPLTPQQRSDMLNMIANTTGANMAGNFATAGNSSANNALTNPQPPPMPNLPQLSDLAQTDEQLNLLQRLSDEQANKVQNLADRLGPLSPSGIIPGLHNDSIPPPLPENWNLDDWINDSYELPTYDGNHDSTFNDLNPYFEAADTNAAGFGSNGMSGGGGGGVGGDNGGNEELFASEATQGGHGRVESVSSRATTPLRTVAGEDNEGSGRVKKRKRNN